MVHWSVYKEEIAKLSSLMKCKFAKAVSIELLLFINLFYTEDVI